MTPPTLPCHRAPLAAALMAVFLAAASPAVQAGATIPFGDGESFSIGIGMRSSLSGESNAAPDGTDRSSNFALESLRLYMGASLNQYIKAVVNTERASDGSMYVLDGYAAFELDPSFNVWAGRLLPPSDRQNLDGPYYQLAYDYPGLVSNFYSLKTGRDDGVTFWGKVADKKLVYSIGAFQGRNHSAGVASNTSNQSANLLYAGRLAYNFLTPEPTPGYYEGSSYFGTAGEILTLAVAGMSQSAGVGNTTASSSYQVYDIDAFYELPIAGGAAFDLSGAYYKYDYSVAAFAVDATSGAGISAPGKAYLLEGGYLIGEKVGVGRFQPFLRYQKFDHDAGGSGKLTDFGVNYIVKGSDAKFSAFYAHDDESGTGAPSTNTLKLALQLQF